MADRPVLVPGPDHPVTVTPHSAHIVVTVVGECSVDAVWVYESPREAVAGIKDHVRSTRTASTPSRSVRAVAYSGAGSLCRCSYTTDVRTSATCARSVSRSMTNTMEDRS